MNGLPYYKAYPRDFIEGTIGMDFETKAAYRLVLDLIYMQGGNLPDDARYISGLLGCSVKKWNLLRKTLVDARKIYVRGEFLGNYRADKELESLGTFQEKQRKNRSNPNKNNGIKSPTRDHTEPDTDTTTEGKPSVVSAPDEKPTSSKAKRGTRIPDDWSLSPEDRQYALSKGIPPDRVDEVAEEFRNFWKGLAGAKGTKLDWRATWQNRCIAVGRQIAERQSRFPPKPPDKPKFRNGFAEILYDMNAEQQGFFDDPPDRNTEPEIIPPDRGEPRGFRSGGADIFDAGGRSGEPVVVDFSGYRTVA